MSIYRMTVTLPILATGRNRENCGIVLDGAYVDSATLNADLDRIIHEHAKCRATIYNLTFGGSSILTFENAVQVQYDRKGWGYVCTR